MNLVLYLMRVRKYKYFACDFETTVYKGQVNTEVWASACVELESEEVFIFHSIQEQYAFFQSLKCNVVAFYHNLKFDGSFWMYYLLHDLKYQQATEKIGKGEYDIKWKKEKDMENKTFKYSISDKGQWYTFIIKTGGHIIEIRDSLKLLPFSVKRIGQSFKTKHKKLEMEYTGFRYAGCKITDDEKEYIANDVLVVKEALEFMFNEGHDRLTIGSCCLQEFKSLTTKERYAELFPNVYSIWIDKKSHHFDNAGDWIRKSYKGGWCYLVKGKEGQIKKNGTTADVNSLYPSMMSSESGNRFPIGKPKFWTGNYIPDEAVDEHIYYFVRIKTRFYIKNGYLPFIQIKGNFLYSGTEALESSDVYDKKTDSYSAFYTDFNGQVHDTRVELTLTMTDYTLFLEHYNVIDFEILDGCYFTAMSGIFDAYIEKYKQLKLNSSGAMRELAKLFLNNLYGKLASNTDSSFKYAYLKEDDTIGYVPVEAYDKEPGYIPVGSAITSYARNFTIRVAQKNFHGLNKRGFIYADTDSIHCDLAPDEITGITVHDKNFCCWKLESHWDVGIFARQKTYIEHVTAEDCQPIETPYYNVKCAGMPDKCKELFIESITGSQDERRITADITEDGKTLKQYTPEEIEFLFNTDGTKKIRTLSDFKVGLKIPGKLLPKNIRGGIILKETTYQMR